MEENILRDVRVLVVEDDVKQLEGIERDLQTIDRNRLRLWGVDSFQCTLAASVEEAAPFLEENGPPCDILILDISLPERRGCIDAVENGYMLLESARKKAKEVVIVSVFSEYENVIKAVRQGAVDFIAKPFKTALLQARVLESWKRVLEKDSADLLQERIRDLALYNERGLAYRYTVRFHDLANDLLNKAARMEQHAHDRYGLDRKRTPHEQLIESLMEFEASIAAGKEKWVELQVPSLPPGETHGTGAVEAILHSLESALSSCLIVKRVELQILSTGETKILTFKDDVRSVLREILCGLLAELPDYGRSRNAPKEGQSNGESAHLVRIEVSSENGRASVKFTDDLPPITNRDAKQISAGSFSVSEPRFSRAWGLAVMQHIAVLGGGRLLVEPQQQGNAITFLIPLDDHA